MRLQEHDKFERGCSYINADTGRMVGRVMLLNEVGEKTATIWRAEPKSELPAANFCSLVAAQHYLKAAAYEAVMRLDVGVGLNVSTERFKSWE